MAKSAPDEINQADSQRGVSLKGERSGLNWGPCLFINSRAMVGGACRGFCNTTHHTRSIPTHRTHAGLKVVGGGDSLGLVHHRAVPGLLRVQLKVTPVVGKLKDVAVALNMFKIYAHAGPPIPYPLLLRIHFYEVRVFDGHC